MFHGIHWARIDQANPVYGEIDFIVMNRNGRLLAIEQKDAAVTVVRNDLMVHYRNEPKPKSVTTQVSRNLNGLRRAFNNSHPGRSLTVDHLLYLPESHISGQLPAGVDASRVVDASKASELVSIIEGLFEANPMPQGEHPADPVDILNFLSQRFGAMPHIGLLGERARSFSSRLSAGLATWALGRKNSTSSSVQTGSAKLNNVNPEKYLTHVLKLIADHPINQIEDLLPWRVTL